MSKIKHVLGISGGKDSAALAIYLQQKHPELDLEYYFTDTGKELDETYKVIENLESYLGKPIRKLNAAEGSPQSPFDHFLELNGGYLPSSTARWCTKSLKLDPFEKEIAKGEVVSYVGIRGDEDREGYISTKPNIQSIFPFRRNIWSEDVVRKVLNNAALGDFTTLYQKAATTSLWDEASRILKTPVSPRFNLKRKLNALLDVAVVPFNEAVFSYLKAHTEYPLRLADDFSLVYNEDNLVRADIFALLEESGVGVPAYYKALEYEVDGQKGNYSRTRSGCYFCFYQQKIEWVWLYENHRTLFEKAKTYEKEGFTWNENETLEELALPERIAQIKREHLARQQKSKVNNNSAFLLDILDDEASGCASCFI